MDKIIENNAIKALELLKKTKINKNELNFITESLIKLGSQQLEINLNNKEIEPLTFREYYSKIKCKAIIEADTPLPSLQASKIEYDSISNTNIINDSKMIIALDKYEDFYYNNNLNPYILLKTIYYELVRYYHDLKQDSASQKIEQNIILLEPKWYIENKSKFMIDINANYQAICLAEIMLDQAELLDKYKLNIEVEKNIEIDKMNKYSINNIIHKLDEIVLEESIDFSNTYFDGIYNEDNKRKNLLELLNSEKFSNQPKDIQNAYLEDQLLTDDIEKINNKLSENDKNRLQDAVDDHLETYKKRKNPKNKNLTPSQKFISLLLYKYDTIKNTFEETKLNKSSDITEKSRKSLK